MTAALANGPVTFTDNAGRQVLVPNSAIYFDAGGKIQADKWPLYAANKALLDPWLNYLARSGAIVPDTTAPPKVAMVIKAADAGAAGNNIQVAFSNVQADANNPGNSKMDVTVTERNTYQGLKLNTIKSVIGTDTTQGSQPGLVHLKGAADPTDLPKEGDYQLQGGDDATPKAASKGVTKDAGGGDAFTLEAKRPGQDSNNIVVTVKDLDKTAGTFTLVAVYKRSSAAIKVSDFPAASPTGYAYELAVTPPSGGALSAPAPGTVTLSGGSDQQAAASASASVVSGQ
jgi:hypothetical protein